jgi:threonine dehydratase
MRRSFSLLLQNKPGVLLRAAQVLTARGCNVEDLRVSRTEDPFVSRMTLEAETVAEQTSLLEQLRAVAGVLEARDLTSPAIGQPREAGDLVTLQDIEAAMTRIRGSIPVTPLVLSEWFSNLTGSSVYFKLENLQFTGSFKERGALNRILTMTPEERERGVITASAGNHAQAVAYHAVRQGVRCVIVMPEIAPLTKVVNTQAYGATVIQKGGSFDEAVAEARRICEAENMMFLHAFDDHEVISGQGTLGLEMLEQCPMLDAVMVPVGGGGLLGGIACAIKAIRPEVRMIGVEAARVPSMMRAREMRSPVTVSAASTIADGIAVRRAGDRTLPLVEKYVDEMVTVEEEEIAKAILLLLEREKTLAEGAGAAALAALLHHRVDLRGKKVAVLICGGNIDVMFLSRIIERGLVKDGRLLRLQVFLPDHPGSLSRLTQMIAGQRANVIEVHHERAYYGVNLGDTMIEVTVETRGTSHSDELISALVAAGFNPKRVV